MDPFSKPIDANAQRVPPAEPESATDLPPVLTVDELAAYMRVNRKTVYALVRAGGYEEPAIGSLRSSGAGSA